MNDGEVIITFNNVQSVKSGSIKIKDNAINIKYGYNGLGKSSIGKAIDYKINQNIEEMELLKPYSGGVPFISISKEYGKSCIFNNEYIEGWLFKENENLINESYSVFYRSKALQSKESDILNIQNELKASLSDEKILFFIEEFGKIGKNISLSKNDTDINGRCALSKGFQNGPNLVKKVEESELKEYTNLLSAIPSHEWFDWFSKGKKYALDKKCPYCLHELKDGFDKIQDCVEALVADDGFKKNKVAKETVDLIASLSEKNEKAKLIAINESKDPLDDKSKSIIIENFKKVKNEYEKIVSLSKQKQISIDMDDKNQILEFYKNNKLDEDFFENSNGDMLPAIKKINAAVENLINNTETLFMAVEQFNNELANATQEVNSEINNFLKFAGIPYQFKIEIDGDQHSKTIICPIGNEMPLENVEKHLSYGELNSFSLALFGAINKRNDSDLIILDDPISSFDENKKFALMHYLFNPNDGVLKDKTVILLTHDMEPLIDMVRADFINGRSATRKEIFANLILNNNGVISEKEITQNDVKSSIKQELDLAKDTSLEEYLRIIHLRRWYELEGNKNSPEYHVASNAEHLRTIAVNRSRIPLDPTDFLNGCQEIKNVILTFDYDSFVSRYSDTNLLNLYDNSTNNYDKVRLIRPLLDHHRTEISQVDMKLWNFITENYHVENMYLFSILDVKQIPDYIIVLCDELIRELRTVIH